LICAVHALVGATAGRLAGRPVPAFAAGISTHLLGDLLPHKDFDPKIEAPLLAATLAVLAWRFGVRSPEFVGAFGGIAPDFENAAMVTGLLPRSAMRFPTHISEANHGRKTASALPQGVVASLCAVYLLRGGGSRQSR
jgi:hypothetical protein